MVIDETSNKRYAELDCLALLFALAKMYEHPELIPKNIEKDIFMQEVGKLHLDKEPWAIPKLTNEDVRKAIGNDQVADFFFAGPAD